MVHHSFRVHLMLGFYLQSDRRLCIDLSRGVWYHEVRTFYFCTLLSPKLTLNRKNQPKIRKKTSSKQLRFWVSAVHFQVCQCVHLPHFVWAYFPWLVFSLGKETGPLELYFFFGPSVKDVLRQYHDLTGLPRMVPLAALGKHQSRWNYITPQDVMEVGWDGFGILLQKHWLFG